MSAHLVETAPSEPAPLACRNGPRIASRVVNSATGGSRVKGAGSSSFSDPWKGGVQHLAGNGFWCASLHWPVTTVEERPAQVPLQGRPREGFVWGDARLVAATVRNHRGRAALQGRVSHDQFAGFSPGGAKQYGHGVGRARSKAFGWSRHLCLHFSHSSSRASAPGVPRRLKPTLFLASMQR